MGYSNYEFNYYFNQQNPPGGGTYTGVGSEEEFVAVVPATGPTAIVSLVEGDDIRSGLTSVTNGLVRIPLEPIADESWPEARIRVTVDTAGGEALEFDLEAYPGGPPDD